MKNYIRFLICIAILFSLHTGCALLTKAKDNYTACFDDPDCHAKMVHNSQIAKEIGQTAGSATGFPVAGTVAGSVFATLGLVLTGVFAGAKLNKKGTAK